MIGVGTQHVVHRLVVHTLVGCQAEADVQVHILAQLGLQR